jgi:hypothetical protein
MVRQAFNLLNSVPGVREAERAKLYREKHGRDR